MASTVLFKQNAEGKDVYRTVACNGRGSDGKVIRKTWTFEASSLKAAKKKGEQLEFEWKNSNKKTVANPTFNNLVKEWRESDKYNSLSPKTIDRYEGMLKHNIIPEFGAWKLEEIRPLDVKRFISDLRKPWTRVSKNNQNPYSDKTVQGYYILLHTLFDCAVKWEMVSENVCDKVDKPQIKKHQANFYDTEQIDKMLACLEEEGKKLEISLLKRNPNHRNKTEQRKKELKEERRYMYKMHRAYVYLALASACRRSELCGPNWTDINFDTAYMSINKTLQYSHSAGKFE